MRLGEVKNIIKKVLNENNQIIIEHEAIYGGQAYLIKNFKEIMSVFDILTAAEWNNNDSTEVNNIKQKYEKNNPVLIEVAEFNQLNSYIASLNNSMPLYYSILDSITEKQEEMALNIKLPEGKIKKLEDLSSLNANLEKILKRFNIDGEFQFSNFDTGTNWYVIIPAGILSYRFIIACLKISQEYLKTKKEYFNSKKAKLDFKASLKNSEDYSVEDLEKYTNKRLELLIEDKVKDAIEIIGDMNGHAESELHTKLVIATKELIKELDDGVEFHLSLNPPEYAREQAGSLIIDYKKLEEIKRKNIKGNEANEIEAPKQKK